MPDLKSMSFEFNGKKFFLVTGTSGGIGKATAELLANNGNLVFATVCSQKTADDLRNISVNICHVMMEVTSRESIENTLK